MVEGEVSMGSQYHFYIENQVCSVFTVYHFYLENQVCYVFFTVYDFYLENQVCYVFLLSTSSTLRTRCVQF